MPRWLRWLNRILRGKWLPNPPAVDPPVNTGSVLLDEINRYRKKHGLRSVLKNECLAKQATKHADYMFRSNNLSHNGFSNRLSACNLSAGGENVAWNYATAKGVVQGWDSSKGHRATMLGEYAIAGSGEVGNYWCLIMAR